MSEPLSLRETLEAASKGEEAEAPVLAQEPAQEAISQAAEPVAPQAETGAPEAPSEPTDGARARDESGRFAKAPEPGQETAIEPATAPDADPPSEPIRVPASLPAPLKAKFKDLPPEWQSAIQKQDEDRTAAKAQWDTKAERFNRLEEILAPRREKFQLQGLDDARAIQTLFAAQDMLDRNPLEGLSYLARSYGVDLRQIGAQPAQAQQGTYPPELAAALQPIMSQVQTLQQSLAERDQAAANAELHRGLAEIEAFRSDPANLYFDDVRANILALMETGRAATLKDAYEAACWADPVVRPLLIEQREATAKAEATKAQTDAKAKAEADARAKANAAQRAGGSVTGAPGSTVAQTAQGSKGSIMADLRAAVEQIGSGV